jgi:hypothetical protein
MNDSKLWQQAWERAQPSIQVADDSLAHMSPLRPRILRVGQLDAELLDQELAHLLQAPLSSALATFHVGPSVNACCKIFVLNCLIVGT